MIRLNLDINNKGLKEYLIPSCNELTVNQYVKFMNKDKQDIINYLSVVLGIEYKAAWNLNIKNSDQLMVRIGDIEDYSKLKPRKYLLGYECKEISSIGQRFVIEESGKNLENEELMCFELAVALIDEPDIDKINELKNKLMNMPYFDILPTAFFLHMRFIIGKIKEMKFLTQLILLTKIKILKNKQVLKN